jgi:hypothetical protein
MKSKPILLSMVFSTVIIFLSLVDINLYKLPFKASFESLDKETQKQVTCLADNMYFEAAHEPLAGKKAVAFVTTFVEWYIKKPAALASSHGIVKRILPING